MTTPIFCKQDEQYLRLITTQDAIQQLDTYPAYLRNHLIATGIIHAVYVGKRKLMVLAETLSNDEQGRYPSPDPDAFEPLYVQTDDGHYERAYLFDEAAEYIGRTRHTIHYHVHKSKELKPIAVADKISVLTQSHLDDFLHNGPLPGRSDRD